jgi:hypothetical protein
MPFSAILVGSKPSREDIFSGAKASEYISTLTATRVRPAELSSSQFTVVMEIVQQIAQYMSSVIYVVTVTHGVMAGFVQVVPAISVFLAGAPPAGRGCLRQSIDMHGMTLIERPTRQ